MAFSSQKERREQFFANLDHLDDLVGEEDDVTQDRQVSRPLHSHRSERQSTLTPKKDFIHADSTRRSPWLHCSASRAVLPVSSSVAESRGRRPAVPRKPQSDTAIPKLAKKPSGRGAKTSLNAMPEEDQIFNGQTFYFIPNDDVAIPRKKRIEKALQYGAVWVRELSENVTYVVVDCSLTMDDVLKAFVDGNCPSTASLVKDTWLTESIGFKEMRNPAASRFQVPPGKSGATQQTYHSRTTPQTRVAKMTLQGARSPGPNHPLPLSHIKLVPENENTARDTANNNLDSPRASPISRDVRPQYGPARDVLDDIVKEVIDVKDLPLDDDGDDSTSSFAFSQTDPGKQPTRQLRSSRASNENKGFHCMQRHDGRASLTNPNIPTVEILEKMASYYDRVNDNWRTLGYRRCISALLKQNRLIATKEEALAIPLIGERLAAKIEEIVTTNRLRRLESTEADPKDQILQLFMGIYQVGYPTALKWIAQGYRTLEELKSKADLTANQKIGIDHYCDFLERICRDEVRLHADIVRRALHAADTGLTLIIGGSYRRGDADSGDIDLLITKKNGSLEHIRTLLVDSVVPKLTEEGFLKAALAAGQFGDDGSKWHGACALPESKTWRRIDLLFVPWDELGAALIYFTGNSIFNRSIRLLASRKGMRLNQHGLFKDVMRGERRQRMTGGTLVEGQSEERIFEILGVPWRPPEHRRC